MLQERDPIAARREPQVAEVPPGRVEDLADRILQPILAVDFPDDGEAFAVGRPVRLPDALEHLARRAAAERHAGQSPGEEPMVDVSGMRQQRELALG